MRIIFFTFQGHSSEVHSVCWDTNGDYLASVSRDSVRVWSIASGECIHELSSSGNMFNSCVFHPSYSSLLVLGGYQVIHCLKLSLFPHYIALFYPSGDSISCIKSLSLGSSFKTQLVVVLSC